MYIYVREGGDKDGRDVQYLTIGLTEKIQPSHMDKSSVFKKL